MKRLKMTLAIAFGLTVIGVLLVGGDTVALFTDDVYASTNTFVSGKLNVRLDQPDGDRYFSLAGMAPGDTGSAEMVVSNAGSLDLHYRLNLVLAGSLAEGATPLQLTVRDADGLVIDTSAPRALEAGREERLTLCWELPQAAGNEYQAATATLDIQARAEQMADIISPSHP